MRLPSKVDMASEIAQKQIAGMLRREGKDSTTVRQCRVQRLLDQVYEFARTAVAVKPPTSDGPQPPPQAAPTLTRHISKTAKVTAL